jgi:hypothetical protein
VIEQLKVGESTNALKNEAPVLVVDGLHNLSARGEMDDIK